MALYMAWSIEGLVSMKTNPVVIGVFFLSTSVSKVSGRVSLIADVYL